MIAISLSKINKEYNSQPILKEVSFAINHGDKIGLIGKNGTGKTTILRLIAGLEDADSGQIYIDKNLKIAYLTQLNPHSEISILDFALAYFEKLIEAEQELIKMEGQMSEFEEHGSEFAQFLDSYHRKQEDFEKAGGYLFRSRAKGILNGIGFQEKDFGRSLNSLSGGQLARLKLARQLIEAPDILLLDEPTNHLDIKTTNWLESYLKSYDKTIILVSHDRFFLDAICNKTMEIESQSLVLYQGNYSSFRQKKEVMIAQRAKEYQKAQKEIARQEEIIRRFKGHGTELLAKRAKSREKALAKMQLPTEFKRDNRELNLNLALEQSTGHEVLRIENISKSYAEKQVIKDVNFNLFKGEKIGLIGNNGCGKTTLLKIISGDEKPDNGKINYGHHVNIAYYDQNHSELNAENTIFEEIHELIPQAKESEVRSLLGMFLFSGDEVFKRINVLSGGEKARLMLNKLFLKKANLLLLDEPTNHLDIYSKEALEKALENYQGSIIAVSHDRYFLNKICNQTIEIEDGIATLYHGNYDYYSEKKSALLASANTEEVTRNKTQLKQNRKLQKQKQNELKQKQKAVKELEDEIEKNEARIEEINLLLCQNDIYDDHQRVHSLNLEQIELKKLLSEQYQRWEIMSAEIE